MVKPTHVDLYIHPAIETANLNKEEQDALITKVYDVIKSKLPQSQKYLITSRDLLNEVSLLFYLNNLSIYLSKKILISIIISHKFLLKAFATISSMNVTIVFLFNIINKAIIILQNKF